MEIEILLWLQNLRDALGPQVEEAINAISKLPTSPLAYAIALLLYWWFDKHAGQFVLAGFGLSTCVNNLIKSTFCINRPWILDSRIQPSEAALPDATGYSFPSGHTEITTAIYGGAGWYYRKYRWPLVLGILITLMVAFSRCYLGVHAPKDVLVGMLVAVVSMCVISAVMKRMDQEGFNAERFVIVCLVASVVMVLYVALKPYPAAVEGADPAELCIDTYKAIGAFAGMIGGWYLERRYVNFTTDCAVRDKVIRVVVGLVVAAVVYLACQPLKAAGLNEVYAFASSMFLIATVVWGGPALAQKISAKFAK